MKGILLIDMHDRDQRALNWLKSRTSSGAVQIPHEEIAAQMQCHRNTARAIVERLASAGLLEIDRLSKRGGYVYRVVSKCQ